MLRLEHGGGTQLTQYLVKLAEANQDDANLGIIKSKGFDSLRFFEAIIDLDHFAISVGWVGHNAIDAQPLKIRVHSVLVDQHGACLHTLLADIIVLLVHALSNIIRRNGESPCNDNAHPCIATRVQLLNKDRRKWHWNETGP